jgi:hypothetical protein
MVIENENKRELYRRGISGNEHEERRDYWELNKTEIYTYANTYTCTCTYSLIKTPQILFEKWEGE